MLFTAKQILMEVMPVHDLIMTSVA